MSPIRIMNASRRSLAGVMLTFALFAVLSLDFWHFRTGDIQLTVEPTQPGAVRAASLAPAHGLPPPPRSVVIIVEENKSYKQIIGAPDEAPYLNELAKQSAVFTRSYGTTHPSQPNYMALFAGRTNTNGNGCPARGIPHDAENLGTELVAKNRSFRAYVEDLPEPGFAGCSSGEYARKHAPWTHFTNVPAQDAVPFATLTSYDTLPDVAFVIPNLMHDMHSASIDSGDKWLQQYIAPLIAWASRHESLIIITWDESSNPFSNHIPTLFVGPMIKPGRYDEPLSHSRLLRTVEDLYGLTHTGSAEQATPIVDCWSSNR